MRPVDPLVDRPPESHTSAPAGLELRHPSTPATRHSSLSGFRALPTGRPSIVSAAALAIRGSRNHRLFHAGAERHLVAPSDRRGNLEAGAVQLRDSFSFTVNGGYWPNHEWLSEIVFLGLHHCGGMPLLTPRLPRFWCRNLVDGVVSDGRTSDAPLGVVSLAVIPSAMAWSLRPQLFTLFLVALIDLLESDDCTDVFRSSFLIWANLHGGVVLGIVLPWPLDRRRRPSERRVPTVCSSS